MMEREYLHGRAFVKKVKGKLQIFETPYGLGDFVPVVAEGTTTPRMLKDRFADVVNVKDFGAVGDGIHDDTEAIRAAFASGKNVYIPMGVYVCTGELELVTPGQKVYGAGMGMGYRFPGAWSSTHWSDVSTILMKGEGQKRLRTRIKSRQTVVELGDDPLSVAINIQAEGVVLEDFCVRLDVEVSEEALEACASWNRTPEQQALVEQERTNLGADWDVGIFSGSRTWGVYDRVAVVGYFRQAGFWMDFTQDPNLPRFNDLKGNPYPQSNVPNGNDGHNFFSCYTFGARWGLVWRGPDSDDPNVRFYDNTRDYYDQLTNSTVKDHRGSFGGSDLNCFGCTFYGNSHHTQLQLYPLELKDPLADMGKGAGALFISGLAGNASGRCHGHRFIATRFAACGPWRVCLGVTGRDSFINCVIDIEQLRNIDGSSVKMDDTNNYGPFWCSPYVYDCRLFGQSGLWYRKFLDPETRDLEVLCTDQYGPKESTRLLTRRIDLGVGTVGNVDTGSSYVSLNSGDGSPCLVQFKTNGKLVGSLKHYASGTFAYCQPSDGSSLEKVAIRGGLNGTQIDFRGIANAPVDFYGNSTFGIRLLDYDSHALFFRHEPNNKYMAVDAIVRAAKDGEYSLGTQSARWSQVYASTATISTSDEREKTSVGTPAEALMRAWGKVNFRVFRFKDAVEKKGSDARLHVGVIAQQVIEAFASERLDATRYGLLCYDKWEDRYEDIEIIDQVEVADEEGRIITPQKTHIEHRLVTPAGDRYGIRYEEALALEAAYQRWKLQKIEATLATMGVKL